MKTYGLITGEEPSPARVPAKSELDANGGVLNGVPGEKRTESGMTPQPRGLVRLNAGLLMFLGAVVAVVALAHQAAPRRFDFGVYYYAARMVWDGAGASLYDIHAQHAFQLKYGRPPNLFFNYPPFALLPFLPLALLPPLAAFIGWTICSVGLLTAAIKSLCYRTGLRYDNWPLLLSVAFMPVASSLGHGQLSILVLAAYAWCYALWSDGRRFTGGMVLAVAAFKIQLVGGFLVVLLLKRKWRELSGFGLACLPLLLISDLIVGLPGLLKFPRFLVECEAARQVNVMKMANLRGLVSLVFGAGEHIGTVIILSIAVLFLAALAWKDLDTGFSAGILASMLVSYHFYPQDLSVVLIPLFLAAKKWAPSTVALVAVGAVVLPLASALTDGGYFVLLTIPYFALLLAESWPALATSYRRMVEPQEGASGIG
jgi:hypothetical protein